MNTKIGFKALRVKDDKEEDEKYGLLDSGATHCVREVQEEERYSLIPIKVKVAFESKVETWLFMTRHGTIVGPKGTETLVSVNDLAKTGWKVVWIGDKVEITKGRTKPPVTIKGNTPVLPLKMCLKLIEEIEKGEDDDKGSKEDDVEGSMASTKVCNHVGDAKQNRRCYGLVEPDSLSKTKGN